MLLIIWAVGLRPRGGIGDAPDPLLRRRLLVVVSRAVEDPATTAAIAAEAGVDGSRDLAEVMILAPARVGFFDRWASDLEPARRAAQETLVISVASLAKVGVVAEARVGDEDIVQAVEDQVGSFRATEVILVTARPTAKTRPPPRPPPNLPSASAPASATSSSPADRAPSAPLAARVRSHFPALSAGYCERASGRAARRSGRRRGWG